jgi:hypothetical protein
MTVPSFWALFVRFDSEIGTSNEPVCTTLA